jgi:hypothetical protein
LDLREVFLDRLIRHLHHRLDRRLKFRCYLVRKLLDQLLQIIQTRGGRGLQRTLDLRRHQP